MEMTGGGKPKSGASHHLGNRCAIPTFPPPDYCYIFLKTFARKEPSSPPAPSPSRLILRLEKTAAVRDALTLPTTSDLPTLDSKDEQALDYFVLVDKCEFKIQSRFDGLLFDSGGAAGPQTFEEVQLKPEHDIVSGQRTFARTKIFVPSELVGTVRTALRE